MVTTHQTQCYWNALACAAENVRDAANERESWSREWAADHDSLSDLCAETESYLSDGMVTCTCAHPAPRHSYRANAVKVIAYVATASTPYVDVYRVHASGRSAELVTTLPALPAVPGRHRAA